MLQRGMGSKAAAGVAARSIACVQRHHNGCKSPFFCTGYRPFRCFHEDNVFFGLFQMQGPRVHHSLGKRYCFLSLARLCRLIPFPERAIALELPSPPRWFTSQLVAT